MSLFDRVKNILIEKDDTLDDLMKKQGVKRGGVNPDLKQGEIFDKDKTPVGTKDTPVSRKRNKSGTKTSTTSPYTQTSLVPGEQKPLGRLVQKVSKDRKTRGLKIGDIDFKDNIKLQQQRAARIDPKTGKATKKGIENYIMNRRDKSFTSNQQLKKNQADAKRILANPTGKEYKRIEAEINKSDYAGKRNFASKSELKNINKEIKKSTTINVKAPLDGRNIQRIKTEPTKVSRIKKPIGTNLSQTQRNAIKKERELKKEIGKRITAQDNLRRNVYRDYDPDGGELQGRTTDTSTKNTTKNTKNVRQPKVNPKTGLVEPGKYGAPGKIVKKKISKFFTRLPKDSRQIVVNPNKRQQQRKTIETLRQTNRNRTVSDVRTSPKTEVIRKPKVERDIKSFIDKTKQNRELQRQSRTNIFTKNNQTTRTTTKPLTGQDLKKQIEKIKATIPKVEPPKVEKPVKQFNGKSFDAFMKDSERKRKQALQSVKNIKVEPVTKVGSKVSVGNQIPFVQPGPKRIPNPERVKKIKDYRAMLKSQPKYLRNISKVGRKVPGRYKALGVALGTLGAIYGTSKLVGSGTKPKTTPLVAGGGKDNFVPVSAKINLSKGTRPTFYTKDPSGSGKSIPFKQAFPNAGKVKNT